MSREERLVVRCTGAEKKLLGDVAFALQRTLSDAVRVLVYEKALDLEILIPSAEPDPSRNLAGSVRPRPKTKNSWKDFSNLQ